MAQSISQEAIAITGLPGATSASRYVGGTANGAPTSGTFQVGDFIIDQSATIWICITAGSPGVWSPSESQTVYTTSTSYTATLGQFVVVNGGGSGVIVTCPASPVEGTAFGIVNNANNGITLKANTGQSLFIGGTNYGAGVGYTVDSNGVYTFIYDAVSTKWYATSTNDIGDTINTLGTTRGGTGLTTFTAANNAIYSTSSSALTAGTLPILAGGTGATTASGALTNLGALASNVTSLPSVTSVNGTGIPSSATLLTSGTTSLPNVTSVNGTAIPPTATLVTTLTGTLPNLTTVNGTSIPASATLLTATSTSSALTKVGLASAGFVKSDASGNLSVDTNTYLTSSTGVTNFSGGLTGLLPSTPTSGAISLSGTLAVGYGGTGTTTSTGTGSVVLSQTPTFTPSATTNIGMVIKGLASQTADLIQFQNSALSVLASLSSAGTLTVTALAGTTLSGTLNANSNRITNLPTPGAANDPARAGDFGATNSPIMHINGFTVYFKAWTFDPVLVASVGSGALTTGTAYYASIYVPETIVVGFIQWYNVGAGSGLTDTTLGIYSTDGRTLLAYGSSSSATGGGANSLVNVAIAKNGSGGTISTVTLTAGVYWVAITQTGTTGSSILKSASATAGIINMNITAGTGTLNGRAQTSFNSGTSGAYLWSNLNSSGVVLTNGSFYPWFALSGT